MANEVELNPVQEDQAARIRWLLKRVSPEVYFEFARIAADNPFPSEAFYE